MLTVLLFSVFVGQAQSDNMPVYESIEALRDEIIRVKGEMPELKKDPTKLRAAAQDIQIAAFQLYLTARLQLNPTYPKEWKEEIPTVIAKLKQPENRAILNRVDDLEEPSFFMSATQPVTAWMHLLPGQTEENKKIYFGALKKDFFSNPSSDAMKANQPYFDKAREVYREAAAVRSIDQLTHLEAAIDDKPLAALSFQAAPFRSKQKDTDLAKNPSLFGVQATQAPQANQSGGNLVDLLESN